MEVLVTGASGYIGGAVAQALDSAGHSVLALAHSSETAAAARDRGWIPVPGDLRDAAGLERIARSADAVVHAGNAGGDDAARIDGEATRALLRAVSGSGKPFVYTSGAWVLGAGSSDETTPPDPPALVGWRAELEAEVVGSAPGARAVVLRPGIVFGRGGGIPGMLARGDLPLVGAGAQRWPLIHLDDLADLYVRALQAPAGAILHGVAASLTMREVALLGAAGQHRAAPDGLPLEEARRRLGPFADALALDQEVSAQRTRDLLGWHPRRTSPIEDLLAGAYGRSGPSSVAA